jgi:recombination protein RecA
MVAAIRARWGASALRPLGEVARAEVLPTGFSALDAALAGGGLPRGQIAHLLGAPTSGKTTLALKVIANGQALGEPALYIDLSRALDPDYARRCGVDLERFALVWPESAALGLAVARDIVALGSVGVVVLDATWGARRGEGVSVAAPRLAAAVSRSSTVFVCLTAPGSGGLAPVLAPYAGLRLRLARGTWRRAGRDVSGYDTRVTILKDSGAAPGRAVTIRVAFDATVQGDGA